MQVRVKEMLIEDIWGVTQIGLDEKDVHRKNLMKAHKRFQCSGAPMDWETESTPLKPTPGWFSRNLDCFGLSLH